MRDCSSQSTDMTIGVFEIESRKMAIDNQRNLSLIKIMKRQTPPLV
jgi:hypothetical protein